MKILLVYPEYPSTFWGFKYALKFIFKKAVNPPLGLLTVAAMLPEDWEKKLVDMNLTTLNDKDLKWADFVFISAISIQKESVKEIITRCKKVGVKIVAGGPLFTTEYEEFEGVDHFVLMNNLHYRTLKFKKILNFSAIHPFLRIHPVVLTPLLTGFIG